MKGIFNHIMSAVAIAVLTVSCGGATPDPKPDPQPDPKPVLTHEQTFDGTYYHDTPKAGWETETKARADLMKDIAWTPMKDMPQTGLKPGAYFSASIPVTGAPYSDLLGGKKGILGRDISLYTFMSALNDPQNQIYTVDYRTATSYTVEATMYGCQCSNTLSFVWGLPIAYSTKAIDAGGSPCIRRKASQKMEELEIFDGIVYYSAAQGNGHAMMVYDILRDKDGKMLYIEIFESAHPTVRLTRYTPSELKKRFDDISVTAYFYNFNTGGVDPKMTFPSFLEQSLADVKTTFPSALCVNVGDKVSLALGSPVTIDINSMAYTDIELYKDDVLYAKDAISGTKKTYDGLPAGLYKARLSKGTEGSEYTYFELGPVDFEVSFSNDVLTVTCMNNVPQYVSINDDYGSQLLLTKTGEHTWTWKGNFGPATHARAHFAGKYGSYSATSSKKFK